MIARITKIWPLRPGAGGQLFARVDFRSLAGAELKTYLCPTNVNYPRWKPLLLVNNVLENLDLIVTQEGLINADSYPQLCKDISFHRFLEPEKVDPNQLSLF